jgi:hypothetical protein
VQAAFRFDFPPRGEYNPWRIFPAIRRVKMKQAKTAQQFVLCVKNDQYPASLEVRKIYQVVPDAAAARHRLVRVIDESGEDYLYPSNCRN